MLLIAVFWSERGTKEELGHANEARMNATSLSVFTDPLGHSHELKTKEQHTVETYDKKSYDKKSRPS